MSAEQLANLYQDTLASNYTMGAGSIVVTSGTGAPSTGPFTLTILDSTGATVLLLFRVTSVSGTTFNGAAEGSDANAPLGSLVVGTTLSVAAITNLLGAAGITFAQVYGDAFTAPAVAQFPVQQASGAATSISFTDTTNPGWPAVLLSATCTSNDTNIVAELYAVPSVPYGLRMRFWPASLQNDYQTPGGMALYDSGSGHFVLFELTGRAGGSSPEIIISQFSNASTYSTNVIEAIGWGIPGRAGLIDMYLHDDGTTRKYYIIGDGSLADAVEIHSEASGTYVAPTHVGIFVAPGHNQTPYGLTQMTVVDWTQGA